MKEPEIPVVEEPEVPVVEEPEVPVMEEPEAPQAEEPMVPADQNLSGLNAQEREMVEYVNQERAKAGLALLQVDLTWQGWPESSPRIWWTTVILTTIRLPMVHPLK